MDIEEEMKVEQTDIQYTIDEGMYHCPDGFPQPDIESLIHEAKNFKILYDEFQKEPFFTQLYYYLISAKWLRRWKIFVSYHESTSAAPPTKYIGKGSMPKLNENIMKPTLQAESYLNEQQDYLSVSLKQGLQEQKDYVFVSENIWYLFKKYNHVEVKRFVVDTIDGKKVELYFQEINLIPVFAQLLKSIEHEKISKLSQLRLQVSHYISIQKLHEFVRNKLRRFVDVKKLISSPSYSYSTYSSIKQFEKGIPLKMWLLPEDTRPNTLYNQFFHGCKSNTTFTYKLHIEGEYLEPEKNIHDYDILSNSLILVEMKQQSWIFWSKLPVIAQCSYCKKVAQLNVSCSCKIVIYCSKKCKNDNKSTHKYRCPNEGQSDEEQVQIKFDENSRYGLVGLRNLGNTCFMNSGLQCLSHIMELTNYFLENKYLQEINKENPLGTGGELSKAYAKMLQNLWMGTEASFSPTSLKRAISNFQNMFSGYAQHDSGQLVSFLLDGLHEDLNRVKQKPYVQTKDDDKRSDFIVAKQAWENHLKRNQSIITDLMFGQFKSILDCPECKYKSVQFDPFLVCSLPLKNDNIKKINLYFVKNTFNVSKLTISYLISDNFSMYDLFSQVRMKLGLNSQTKLLAYSSSQSGCQRIQQTQRLEYVRKQKLSYRKLFIRQLLDHEDPENDVSITIAHVSCSSMYGNESYRRTFTYQNLFYFKRTLTFKQLHTQIYQTCNQLYPTENYYEEVIKVEQKQQPFRILLIQPWKYGSSCIYCGEKSCSGCPLPYHQNRTLSEYVTDQNTKIQIEFYWRKNHQEIKDKYEEMFESIDKQSKQNNNNGTNIQQCFKLFEQAQTLGQQNAWFCPKCKDFVLAKKQMHIYKAPKVIVICLKRFKRKQYHTDKYNILVDFPLKGLDVAPFVMNHNLPEQYFKGENQMNLKKDSLIYDLVGITNHFGGTGGGHYTAYCMDPRTERWYDFDDSHVSELKSAESAVTQHAYMLYYQRRE